MTTYKVTVSVPAAPRLGSVDVYVEATGAAFAEHKALKAIGSKWACGAPFAALAVAA